MRNIRIWGRNVTFSTRILTKILVDPNLQCSPIRLNFQIISLNRFHISTSMALWVEHNMDPFNSKIVFYCPLIYLLIIYVCAIIDNLINERRHVRIYHWPGTFFPERII